MKIRKKKAAKKTGKPTFELTERELTDVYAGKKATRKATKKATRK